MSAKPTIADIIAAVELVTQVDAREISGPTKVRRISKARKLVCFVASQCYGLDNPTIGTAINRSRKTVCPLIAKLTANTLLDPDLIDQIETIVDAAVQRRSSAASNATMETAS